MRIETVVEKIERTTYVADDGKVFYDMEACEQYEEWQRLKHIPFPEIYFVHAPDEHYSYGLVMLHTQDEFDKIKLAHVNRYYDIDCDAPKTYPCQYLLCDDCDNRVLSGGWKSPRELLAEYEEATNELRLWVERHNMTPLTK